MMNSLDIHHGHLHFTDSDGSDDSDTAPEEERGEDPLMDQLTKALFGDWECQPPGILESIAQEPSLPFTGPRSNGGVTGRCVLPPPPFPVLEPPRSPPTAPMDTSVGHGMGSASSPIPLQPPASRAFFPASVISHANATANRAGPVAPGGVMGDLSQFNYTTGTSIQPQFPFNQNMQYFQQLQQTAQTAAAQEQLRAAAAATHGAAAGAAPSRFTSMYSPPVSFPMVPFWTACPLPFSPYSYPGNASVLPPPPKDIQAVGGYDPLQYPAGTEKLLSKRPTERDLRLAKYKLKRRNRKHTQEQKVDMQRSALAKARTRDSNGQFAKEGSGASVPSTPEGGGGGGGAAGSGSAPGTAPGTPAAPGEMSLDLKLRLEELQSRLSATEYEVLKLREKLVKTEEELACYRGGPNSPAMAMSPTTTIITDLDPSLSSSLCSPGSPGSSPPLPTGFAAFAHKVDFSKIELRKTNSSLLEDARREVKEGMTTWGSMPPRSPPRSP